MFYSDGCGSFDIVRPEKASFTLMGMKRADFEVENAIFLVFQLAICDREIWRDFLLSYMLKVKFLYRVPSLSWYKTPCLIMTILTSQWDSES